MGWWIAWFTAPVFLFALLPPALGELKIAGWAGIFKCLPFGVSAKHSWTRRTSFFDCTAPVPQPYSSSLGVGGMRRLDPKNSVRDVRSEKQSENLAAKELFGASSVNYFTLWKSNTSIVISDSS